MWPKAKRAVSDETAAAIAAAAARGGAAAVGVFVDEDAPTIARRWWWWRWQQWWRQWRGSGSGWCSGGRQRWKHLIGVWKRCKKQFKHADLEVTRA